MDDFDLTGRVAIITGGNSGIGLGMADALARAGCAVSIWGRNPEKNTRASARLRAYGGAVDTRLCDVSDRKAVEASFAATLLSLDELTRASPMRGSVAGDGKVSSTAPRKSGGACSPSTSIACSTCFNLLPAT